MATSMHKPVSVPEWGRWEGVVTVRTSLRMYKADEKPKPMTDGRVRVYTRYDSFPDRAIQMSLWCLIGDDLFCSISMVPRTEMV